MRCIGYGATEGLCANEAGSRWCPAKPGKVRPPYWCQACDEVRIATIDAQFTKLAEKFGIEREAIQ